MEINKVLAPLGIPVCHPPYSGAAETYITYQFIGQRSTVYAEGKEAETGTAFSVDLYTSASKTDIGSIINNTKKLLQSAGYICTVDMETVETKTQSRHYALTAIKEDAIYV